MKTVLNSLIVWFLLLAVPFQGFASATMLVCAPVTSTAAISTVAAARAPSHDHAAMLAAQTAGPAHHASASAVHGNADEAPATGHHANSKCHSCATCCFGAAMPPSQLGGVPVASQNFPIVAFDAGPVPVVDLALPERPPKSSLT